MQLKMHSRKKIRKRKCGERKYKQKKWKDNHEEKNLYEEQGNRQGNRQK